MTEATLTPDNGLRSSLKLGGSTRLQQDLVDVLFHSTQVGIAELVAKLGVAVYTTDAAGRIKLFNDEAASLWGRRPEIDKDLWCGSWKLLTPEGEPLPLERCPMAIALKENRAVRGVEILIERPNGTRSLVLPYPTPLRDPEGRVIGAVNVLEDISEQKRAADALLRLAAIVESSNDAIVSKDLNGLITSWNPAAESIFGYSAAEAIGKSILLIVPAERQHEEDEVLALVRNGQRLDHFETVRRRKDGSEVDISLTVSPVRDQAGRIVGASKIARDISKRKSAEETIRRAETFRRSIELKNDFLSLVSHELRTPIATIFGNGRLLLSRGEMLAEEDKRQALADIVSEAEKLEENVEHLLLLTRLDRSELELDPVSLPALVTKSIAAFRERHRERRVSFTSEPGIPPALGQETLISLVLQNLLSNADKYSSPEAEIDVSLYMNEAAQPEVRVSDRGIGLDQHDLANLFTPFFRSQAARRQASGMGLGLAVCKRALEAQKGNISAECRAEGGSDFFFSLTHLVDSSC